MTTLATIAADVVTAAGIHVIDAVHPAPGFARITVTPGRARAAVAALLQAGHEATRQGDAHVLVVAPEPTEDTTPPADAVGRQFGTRTVHDVTGSTTPHALPITRCGRTLTDPAPAHLVRLADGYRTCKPCEAARPAGTVGEDYRDAVTRARAVPLTVTPAARLTVRLADAARTERAATDVGPVPAPGIPALLAARLRPSRAEVTAAIGRLVALTDRRAGFPVTVIPDADRLPVPARQH